MNYFEIYNSLIESRKFRVLDQNQYYEDHHILPRCMKGSSKKENIISLTPKEHFIAHMLLFRFTTGKDKVKMGYALHMLSVINEHQEKRYINSRIYSNLKSRIYKEIRGINHPSFGKKMSNKFREKMRQTQLGDTNSMYGKIPWNKGKTKETNLLVKMISEKISGRKVPPEKTRLGIKNKKEISKESRLHYSKCKKGQIPWNKGIELSNETKLKMSISKKGIPQEKIKCPHCNKEGGITMYRWHFDKCKFKEV